MPNVKVLFCAKGCCTLPIVTGPSPSAPLYASIAMSAMPCATTLRVSPSLWNSMGTCLTPRNLVIGIIKFLGVKQVPIEFHKDGLTRSVVAQGIADIAIEAYRGADGEGPVTIGNVQHPFAQNNTLTLGMATRSTFKDQALSWDNTGKNAHYSAFEWSA